MSLASVLQDSFARGIVRSVEGQRIPADGVYDCVNGLLDDDLGVYRRGGSAYLSSVLAGHPDPFVDQPPNLIGLGSVNVHGGPRTVAVGDYGTGLIYALPEGSTSPTLVNPATAETYPAFSRIVGVGGYAALRFGTSAILYGGSLVPAYAAGGTVTATNGSKTVTGAGTTFTGNVDKGSLVYVPAAGVGLVDSVDSNTQLTLRDEWTAPTSALAGVSPTLSTGIGADSVAALAAVGTVPRLLYCVGSRAYFSEPGQPRLANVDSYHQIPDGTAILGAEGVGSNALVFSAGGVWALLNMDYDLTDAYGNPQHRVEQVSKNVVLWGDSGLAGYRGGVVVPALDDVFVMSLTGSEESVSANVRPLYRSYVAAGYKPGIASVHRGHYFLPILNGSTWVDTLVCRLDGDASWVRWSGQAGSRAFTQRVSTTGSPSLLGISASRITNLSGCFAPTAANKNDADGTTHVLTVITRDFAVKAQVPNLWKYLRSRFELVDAASDNPTLTAEYAVGPPETESWTSIGSWSEGTGESSSKLSVGKRAQSIRFRLKTSGPSSRFRLRSLETFFRPSNRL